MSPCTSTPKKTTAAPCSHHWPTPRRSCAKHSPPTTRCAASAQQQGGFMRTLDRHFQPWMPAAVGPPRPPSSDEVSCAATAVSAESTEHARHSSHYVHR